MCKHSKTSALCNTSQKVLKYCLFLLLMSQIVELPNHPYFVGVQFHPEFKSRPGKPSPVFLGTSLITACFNFLILHAGILYFGKSAHIHHNGKRYCLNECLRLSKHFHFTCGLMHFF